MKKLLFISVLGLLALTSCKKEKDCTCTDFWTDKVTTQTTDGDCDELYTVDFLGTDIPDGSGITCVEK